MSQLCDCHKLLHLRTQTQIIFLDFIYTIFFSNFSYSSLLSTPFLKFIEAEFMLLTSVWCTSHTTTKTNKAKQAKQKQLLLVHVH